MEHFPFQVIQEASATCIRGGDASQQAHLSTEADAEVIHPDQEQEPEA